MRISGDITLQLHLSRDGDVLGAMSPPRRFDALFTNSCLTDVWLWLLFLLLSILELLLGALGWLMGGRFGSGTTSQTQPDWFHLAPIRAGFWLGSWA